MVLLKITLLLVSLLGICQCFYVVDSGLLTSRAGRREQPDVGNNLKDVVYWTQWYGQIPKHALVAGFTTNDNDAVVPIYMGRASVSASDEKLTLPVQIFEDSTYAEATYDRAIHRIQKSDESVKVLCTQNSEELAWVPYEKLKGDTVDTDCVVAGEELNDNKVYFGRTTYQGDLKVGKVHFRNHAIYFPGSNKEQFVDRQFEVLCYKQPLVDKKILEGDTKAEKQALNKEIPEERETSENKENSEKQLLPTTEIVVKGSGKEGEVTEGMKIEVPGTTLSLKQSEGVNIFNWNFYGGSPALSNEDTHNDENKKSSVVSSSEAPKLYWREYHSASVPEDAILVGTTQRNGKTVGVYVGQAYFPTKNAGIQSVAIYSDSEKVVNTYGGYAETTKNIKILCTNAKSEDLGEFLTWIPAKDAMKYNAEEDFVITGTEVNMANGEQVYLFSGRGTYENEGFGFVVGKVVTGGSHWRFYFPHNGDEYLKTEDFEILAYRKALDKFDNQ